MGFPIRTSTDQSPLGGSPWLIAARHVLHRWSTPRHPPLALCSLEEQRCSYSLCNSQGAKCDARPRDRTVRSTCRSRGVDRQRGGAEALPQNGTENVTTVHRARCARSTMDGHTSAPTVVHPLVRSGDRTIRRICPNGLDSLERR